MRNRLLLSILLSAILSIKGWLLVCRIGDVGQVNVAKKIIIFVYNVKNIIFACFCKKNMYLCALLIKNFKNQFH